MYLDMMFGVLGFVKSSLKSLDLFFLCPVLDFQWMLTMPMENILKCSFMMSFWPEQPTVEQRTGEC